MISISRLAFTAILLATTAVAQGQAQSGPFGDTPMKKTLKRTQELPNGIAFQTVVNILASYDAKGNRERAVSWIGASLDMGAVEANSFFDQLLVAKQAMDEEIRVASIEHACSDGEAYDILDGMYDVAESILDRYYDESKDSLEKNKGILLENWMAEEKSKITHAHVDFQKFDEQNNTDSTSRLTQICEGMTQ